MPLIPANDIALATRFSCLLDADKMIDRIAADDSEWEYGVRQLSPISFVITVSDEENVFLGYL